MPDQIGNITVPDIVASGTFPIVPDYPYGRSSHPDVAIHQFGTGNAKIEQRFLLGEGAKRFTVRRALLRDADRVRAPGLLGVEVRSVRRVHLQRPQRRWQRHDRLHLPVRQRTSVLGDGRGLGPAALGVTLIEIPASNPTYSPVTDGDALPDADPQGRAAAAGAADDSAHQNPAAPGGYPAIYLSDRRCTVGGQLYLPRLVDFDGISQSMGNEADEATFTFGNADRVMRDLANDVDLFRASISFSLFHVGTQIKLDLWKGDIVNWQFDSGPEFKVTAADGLYELNLPYPCRKVSRTCWKAFNIGRRARSRPRARWTWFTSRLPTPPSATRVTTPPTAAWRTA